MPKDKDMKKSFVSLILLFVTLASAGLTGLLLWERQGLEARLLEGSVKQKQLESELAALRQERDRRQHGSQNATAATPAAEATVPPAAAAAAPKAGGATTTSVSANANAMAPSQKMFAEMLKNPGMKEMMKLQQMAALDSQYGSLFEKFQLSDGEKTDFKQLLGDRLVLQSELGMKLMAEGGNKQQRDALMKEFEESKKTSDADIRKFLNSDEDFATFQRWEDTKGERMQLDMGRSQFTSSGEPLSVDQEQQLVNAMYQARTSPRYGKDLSKPENFDPAAFNESEIGRQLERYDSMARDVYQTASKFLNARQLETLRTIQDQWRSMTKAGLEMSATMFKSQNGN